MNTPRILTFDLEFMASKTYKGDLKIAPGYLICGCVKELNNPKVITYSKLTHPGKGPTDDRDLVKAIGDEIRDADLLIVQYGGKIEIPFMQTLLLKYGLTSLPNPVNVVDTWQLAKSKLALKSNSLASLAQFFKLPKQKMPVTEEEWYLAFTGDKKLMKKVEKRCASDVILTEMVYKRLLPLCNTHPAIAHIYGDRGNRGVCGGEKMEKRGFRVTVKQLYQRLQCSNCGHWIQRLVSNHPRFAKV